MSKRRLLSVSDTVERYGLRLLDAWQKILTDERGQNVEERGHLLVMPPVLEEKPALNRRFRPIQMRKTGG